MPAEPRDVRAFRGSVGQTGRPIRAVVGWQFGCRAVFKSHVKIEAAEPIHQSDTGRIVVDDCLFPFPTKNEPSVEICLIGQLEETDLSDKAAAAQIRRPHLYVKKLSDAAPHELDAPRIVTVKLPLLLILTFSDSAKSTINVG